MLRKVFVIIIIITTNLNNILGEIYELKAELNSDKRERKKEAVKKVTDFFSNRILPIIYLYHSGYCQYDCWKRC
jgi:hypothetical protein